MNDQAPTEDQKVIVPEGLTEPSVGNVGLRQRLSVKRWCDEARGWMASKREAIFLPVDDDTAFPEPQGQLRDLLRTGDVDLAAEILGEAEVAYARLQDRVDSAERRATTLQSASAIAASLTLTAAGLLVDSTKLRGWLWPLLFGAAVTYITFALAMCAWRATLASSRVHHWMTPGDRDVLERPRQSVALARTERAAALLASIGGNQRFARYKVAMLRASTDWILRALVALFLLAVLAAVYGIVGPEAATTTVTGPPTSTATPAKAPTARPAKSPTATPGKTPTVTPAKTPTPTKTPPGSKP
jgi:hypothetical protein